MNGIDCEINIGNDGTAILKSGVGSGEVKLKGCGWNGILVYIQCS